MDQIPDQEKDQTSFKSAIKRDLLGKATEGDMDLLHSDLRLWRDDLIEQIEIIDLQMKTRKLKEIAEQGHVGRFGYLSWKRKVTARKLHLSNRLRDVRAMLLEQHEEERELAEQKRVEKQKQYEEKLVKILEAKEEARKLHTQRMEEARRLKEKRNADLNVMIEQIRQDLGEIRVMLERLEVIQGERRCG
jgi:hypothetical protein